jgi:sulfate transport system substrate-binding protein
MTFRRLLISAIFLVAAMVPCGAGAQQTILNVSYDPTRELYQQYDAAFAGYWKAKTGKTVTINQSHGGSGKQARAVIDGLEADVVTLGLAYDIDAIADKGKLLPSNWQTRLPYNSTPFTSTIVFLVHKGNPKGIKDWPDLIKPDVAVVVANPKTSGGARWAYLSAWAYGLKAGGNNEAQARQFINQLYKHVPVLDSGARGATTTFVERGIGDVLLSWENEAYLALKENGQDKFDIIYPSASMYCEPPVALVDKVVERHGTRQVAEAYLNYLFSPEGQHIGAENYYRPQLKSVPAPFLAQDAKSELVTIKTLGGWKEVQKKHFADGGVFDQIYQPGS